MFVLNVPIGTFNLDPSYDLALLLFVRVRFFIAKKRNCRDSEDALFTASSCFVQFDCCSIFKDHAARSLSPFGPLFGQPLYYITLFFGCQVVF